MANNIENNKLRIYAMSKYNVLKDSRIDLESEILILKQKQVSSGLIV